MSAIKKLETGLWQHFDDPLTLSDEEASLENTEAQLAQRMSGLGRHKEALTNEAEQTRRELIILTKCQGSRNAAAEMLANFPDTEFPDLEMLPERQHANEARRTALEARRNAIAAEAEAIADCETALSELKKAIGELKKRVSLVRAFAVTPAGGFGISGDLSRESSSAEFSPPRQAARVRMNASVDFGSQTNFYAGFGADLSEGGIFVATRNVLPRGTEVDLAFSLPDGKRIEARGIVRWTREFSEKEADLHPGMGIEFLEMSQENRRAVQEFATEREPMLWIK